MSNRVWKILLLLTVALGIFIGYRLAEIPNLQPYKLLNIIGLLYSLLAVFALSEVLVGNPNWKRICVEKIAPVLLWMHITVPIGAVLGAALAWLVRRGPSASVTGLFAVGAFGYMSFVGSVLDQTVVLPRLFKKDIETRWRYFGLILLSSGILFQLISAIKGL
jgi:hypothetical protein